jgi:hypothetical protein
MRNRQMFFQSGSYSGRALLSEPTNALYQMRKEMKSLGSLRKKHTKPTKFSLRPCDQRASQTMRLEEHRATLVFSTSTCNLDASLNQRTPGRQPRTAGTRKTSAFPASPAPHGRLMRQRHFHLASSPASPKPQAPYSAARGGRPWVPPNKRAAKREPRSRRQPRWLLVWRSQARPAPAPSQRRVGYR